MPRRTASAVAVAGAALVAASLVGGAVSVRAGVNRWSDAWTSEATLAAPWPMMLLQLCATVAAAQPRSRAARTGSVVLVLAAGLSGVSGFFDGQLARSDLGTGYVLAQVAYVALAWLAVGCGVARFLAVRHLVARAR